MLCSWKKHRHIGFSNSDAYGENGFLISIFWRKKFATCKISLGSARFHSDLPSTTFIIVTIIISRRCSYRIFIRRCSCAIFRHLQSPSVQCTYTYLSARHARRFNDAVEFSSEVRTLTPLLQRKIFSKEFGSVRLRNDLKCVDWNVFSPVSSVFLLSVSFLLVTVRMFMFFCSL